ncbi:MAG TPA: protein kinase [Candidatus Aphodovivens avistercoris]|nr:protein kinase [Candidatus Aphodovivens avistercoris]
MSAPERSDAALEPLVATPVASEADAEGRGNATALGGAAGCRVLHLDGFEPAEALPPAEAEAYERRFVTLLQEPGAPRVGGSASVLRVSNLWGETFALKVLSDAPAAGAASAGERAAEGSEAAESPEAQRAAREEAFRSEYRLQRALSGLKGFPRVYGIGRMEGSCALVMEWVEGVNLEKAARALSVDDEGRVSPLVTARIGRDLFELVARMELAHGGIVHRDVSTGNVMVRTDRLALEEQVDEGVYDLCLIDFGSALALGPVDNAPAPHTRLAAGRGATPDFAAPELLAGGPATAAADAYAAAGVVWRLATGSAPFGSAATADPEELQQAKERGEAPTWRTAHDAEDVAGVLLRESEVAVAVKQAAADLAPAPAPHEVSAALRKADAQLGSILLACLGPDPAARPDAKQMRDALGSFSFHYAENIGRALRGEPSVPLVPGTLADGYGGAAQRKRTVVRVAGKALGAALGAVALVTAAVLAGMAATPFPGLPLPAGTAAGIAAAAAMALPFAGGAAVRLRAQGVLGLARAATGTALGAAAALAAGAVAAPPSGLAEGLAAALLSSVAGAWCFFAMDFAAPAPHAAHRPTAHRRSRAQRSGAGLPSAVACNAALPEQAGAPVLEEPRVAPEKRPEEGGAS